MDQLVLWITLFLKLLPAIIAAEQELAPVIKRAFDLWSTATPPTDDDWKLLHDIQAKQTAVIQAPIPPEELQ